MRTRGRLCAVALVAGFVGGCERMAAPDSQTSQRAQQGPGHDDMIAPSDAGNLDPAANDQDAALAPLPAVKVGPSADPARFCLTLFEAEPGEGVWHPARDEELTRAAEALRHAGDEHRFVAIEPGTDPAVVDMLAEALRAANAGPFAVEQGELGACGIRSLIRSALPEIRRCYESQLLSEPDLEGTIVVSFVIDKLEGRVIEAARDNDSTLERGAASECILEVFYSLEFPPSPESGLINVRYPMTLQPSAHDASEGPAVQE